MHKAGFVNIVGNPNVGKSTLMNQLVGEKISIATFKAQTTRHRIMGIVNTPDMQIVFSDTPGVLKPNYKMQEMMLAFSESALADADILLYVTDVVENPEKNVDFLEKVREMKIPVLLLINKIDEIGQRASADSVEKPKKEGRKNASITNPTALLSELVEKWHKLLPNAEILPLSAKNKFGIDLLMKRIQELFPEGGEVTVENLVAKGAVRKNELVKVLGDGDITVKVNVVVDKASASAISKIEAAGGSVTVK